MIRASGLAIIAILGGWTNPAAGDEITKVPHADATGHLVQTFAARCLARPTTSPAFHAAGADLDRSPTVRAALERLRARRQSVGTVHDSGALMTPFPVWILVGTARPPNASGEWGSCELVWSGDFPDGLRVALEQRMGRRSNPADPYQGATVYAFPPVPGGKAPGGRGMVMLAEKAPLHSISLVVPLN